VSLLRNLLTNRKLSGEEKYNLQNVLRELTSSDFNRRENRQRILAVLNMARILEENLQGEIEKT